MKLTYHRAALEDLDLLVDTRVIVLCSANGLEDSEEMPEVRAQSREYYETALAAGDHVAYLVLDEDRGGALVGTGAVSFYRVMPTYHNPTGKKAYIMNMYTAPEYRRRGIAAQVLDLLVTACREKGVTFIALEATAAGRPLYEKYGFAAMECEMELPQQ